VWRVQYRVHSTQVESVRWYPTKAEAIAAFERNCKRLGIAPPHRYPPSVSGDSITINDMAYPRRRLTTCSRQMTVPSELHPTAFTKYCVPVVGRQATC